MHSLIIGGGKIGYYLTKVLIEKGYDVSVVEKEKDACQKFANDLNITVICLLYTSPSPRDRQKSRMPSSA